MMPSYFFATRRHDLFGTPRLTYGCPAILIGLVFFLIGLSSAAAFTFDPNIHGTTFNLSEDVAFSYDLNVTVNESFVLYSSNAQALGFNSFAMNNATGNISFTPVNDDVGYYSVTLIAENRSNNFDKVTITVAFNVSNSNDAPNITQFAPSSLALSLAENGSQLFSYNATDIDASSGDSLSTTWFLNGSVLSRNATFNYTASFCDAGFYSLLLKVNDTSNANDTKTWNLSVTNVDRAPFFNVSIGNRTWEEDTNLSNNLTLTMHFADYDSLQCSGQNQDPLVYSVTGNFSIQVVINQTTANVSFRIPPNFFGAETIIFNVSDGYNSNVSNSVVLNVTNVNDAPQFNLTNQTPIQNANFIYDINATDQDNEIQAGLDNLTYYDNSSLFDIGLISGIINFTPSSSGIFMVNVTVNDTFTITSKLLMLNISANEKPTINTIANQNATEGIFFVMNLSASDTDNDTITFSSNFSAFTIASINASLANATLQPTNSHVGNHTVQVTATDSRGASNSTIFTFVVFNVNVAPNLTEIANQSLRTDRAYTLTVTGVDGDNDNLTFGENTSLFSFSAINSTAALISFTPSSSQAGNHTVNITVNDSSVIDWQIVQFTIYNNTAPILANIGNQTIAEDSLLSVQVNASDADGDALTFSANASLFTFVAAGSMNATFNFTPTQSQIGVHWVNITVNDSPAIHSRLIFINVTFTNDTPYFNPPLPSLNATQSVPFFYDVNASDEEGDLLNFTTNATFFNISSNGTINFTPTMAQIGNYSVTINVSDGNSVNSSIINFSILVYNNPPVIASFSPNASNTSVAENGELIFNVSASDPEGNSLVYSWQLNGTQLETNQTLRYQPDFDDAGYYVMSVSVSDGLSSVSQSWNLSVNNTNRQPLFGVVNRTSLADFTAGNATQINVSRHPGNYSLVNASGAYVSEGNYTSPVLDLRSSTNVSLQTISWKESKPENTSVAFYLRTSPDNSTFTNFSASYSNPNGTSINETSDRFVQFKSTLSTTNSNTTPEIEYAVITYEISDFAGREDTIYLNYLDLDNFFSDPDGNSLTYNASTVANIDVDIDSQGRVSLTPDSDFYGSRTVTFSATDGTLNQTSNNVTLTFIDVSDPSTSGSSSSSSSSGGGGGGGSSSTRIILVNQTVLVNQSVSIELVVPGSIEEGVDEEIIVPIRVQNNENYLMSGIILTANTNASDMEWHFTRDTINQLAAGQFYDTSLIIDKQNKSKSFDIRIAANVDNPELNDSATVSIRITENVSAQIDYVRDFIQLNPECLELSEVLEQAKNEVSLGNYRNAQLIIDKALEECRYLLSGKRPNVEQPASLRGSIWKNPYALVIASILGIAVLFTAFYAFYNRFKWY